MPKKGQRKERRALGSSEGSECFATLGEAYLEALRVRNYSEATIAGREHHLREFIHWAEERGLTRPTEVTKPTLERYQRYLYHYRKKNGEPMSFRSQHSCLVPVRAYFKWLCRQNLLLANPAADLDLPRAEKRLPRHVLTAAEAERVLGLPEVGGALGLRDRAILEVIYSTGMRRMEVLGLKLYDLDQERGTVFVRQGKGKKDRMIPMGERAFSWVRRYLEEARPQIVLSPDDGTVFLTNVGQAFEPNRLTQMVRDYVDAAQIGKTGSCHLFRHTCATLMLEGGADIRFIQQLLGHEKLETTQIYAQVSIRMLKEVHTRTHPARLTLDPAAAGAAALDDDDEHVEENPELAAELAAEADEDAEG
jgi:integrase/recombinase XerD